MKTTLETRIRNMILDSHPASNEVFDVIAHELMHDGNSWSTNQSWHLRRGADIESVIESARGRWEVFKVNYAPKARVADIIDSGYDENIFLEVDCIPFLEIRPSRN
jgi:hypothetical protein